MTGTDRSHCHCKILGLLTIFEQNAEVGSAAARTKGAASAPNACSPIPVQRLDRTLEDELTVAALRMAVGHRVVQPDGHELVGVRAAM